MKMDKDILIPLVKGNYIPKKDGLIPFVRGNGLTTSGDSTVQGEETNTKTGSNITKENDSDE